MIPIELKLAWDDNPYNQQKAAEVIYELTQNEDIITEVIQSQDSGASSLLEHLGDDLG